MALFLLQAGVQPIGEFDVLNTDAAAILGGELMTLDVAAKTNSASESAAYDVMDAYVGANQRVVARIADGSDDSKIMYLADEGTKFYGVMFGTIVGGPVGLSPAGANLGPSTLTGSGKVTCWDKPGMYGVSLDAVSTVFVQDQLPGALLYRGSDGRLSTAGTAKVGAFIELSDSGVLVITPPRLVGAAAVYDRVKFQFLGAGSNL